MANREREYQWYLLGCSRLGHESIAFADFAARWQEFEDHAETLKSAERKGIRPNLDAGVRTEMQNRIKGDPFVKAVLVGMSESGEEA